MQRIKPPNKKSRKPAARNWKKGADLQPTLQPSELSAVLEEWKEIIKSSIDPFKAMLSDDLVLHVTKQTNLMRCNMVKVTWTSWRKKLGLLLHFCCSQGIAKFHIKIFIGQIHLTQTA